MARGKVIVVDGPAPEEITSVMADIRALLLRENTLCEASKDFLFNVYSKLQKDAR